jgi:hypothetical protein
MSPGNCSTSGRVARSVAARAWHRGPLTLALLASCLGAMDASPAAAQDKSPALDIQVSNSRPRIGDQVTLRIDTGPLGAASRYTPSVGPDLGPFKVVAVRPVTGAASRQGAASSWDVVVTSFESGRLVVPAILLEGIDQETGRARVVSTRPAVLDVAAPDVDPGGGLKPLKPPIETSLYALAAALAGLCLLGAMGLGRVGMTLVRAGRRRESAKTVDAAGEAARILAGFATLKRSTPITEVQRREACARLFHGMRALLRLWLGIAAEGLSSPELEGLAESCGCPDEVSRELGRALRAIDEARFAAGGRPSGEIIALVSQATAAAESTRRAVDEIGRRRG